MLTTKKQAQIFLIFSIGWMAISGGTGCAPAGARALLKGERLIKEGKYSEAVAKFEEAAKAMPDNAKVQNHLGLGYQYAGDPKKAAQAYQKALALDRNLTAASYNLGNLYLEQRSFPEAIARLTTFVQLEPKNPDGWLKLGNAQMQFASLVSAAEKNHHLDAAKKSFDNSQALRPSPEVLNAIGMLQIQRGRPRDAIPSFTAALQKQSDYAPAFLNLAVVYDQYLNERRLALANYRQFLKVTKESPERAQVEALARQLDAELNPRAVIAPAVPSPIVSKPQTPVATSAVPGAASPIVAKAETNLPETTVPPKPNPIISAPRAQLLPKKEKPVEVAKLPDEVPFKPAQDVSPTNVTKPTAAVSNTIIPPVNPIHTTNPPAKSPGMLAKLNPVSWFKRKPKSTTPLTELPVTKPAIEASPDVSIIKPQASPKTQTKAASAQIAPVTLRYKYRSPTKPSEGKRVEAEPLFQSAVQAQKDRRLADALTDYRRALKLDPSFFEANYNLALAAREAGDLSAALGAYEQALAIMPESVNARYNFAFTLQEAGYFQDAANELEKLLEQNPNETRGQLLLGNLYAQRLNQVSLARGRYLKVLEAEPQHPQATQIRYWLAAHP